MPRGRAGVRIRAHLVRRRRRAGRLRSRLHPGRPIPDHPRTPLRRSDVMKILVTIKQVPDTATQVKIAADGKTIDATGITWIVSPYDEFAVEEAPQLVLCGRQAIDDDMGAVTAQLAELLGWPCAYWIMEETIDADGKAVRALREDAKAI